MSENGHQPEGIPVNPQEVIPHLMNRIANLTMELALKDAYIAQLTAAPQAEVVKE